VPQIPQHIAGKIPVLIRRGASMLQPSNKRKAFLAVLKSGKGEICRACQQAGDPAES